jgi:hypothetical protein
MLFALSVPVEAQQPGKIPRIGYVSGADDLNKPGPEEAFRRGLQELGYVEGKNILVEYRSQEGKADRGPSLVSELIQLKVDVLALYLHLRSVQPSRRPERFPSLWLLPQIQLRLD